jgi:hypothetical protein
MVVAALATVAATILGGILPAFAGGTPINSVAAVANRSAGLQPSAQIQPLSFWVSSTQVDGTRIFALVGTKWVAVVDAGTQPDVPLPLTETGYNQPRTNPLTPDPYAKRSILVQGPRLIQVLSQDVTLRGRHYTESALPGTTWPKGDRVRTVARETGTFGIRFYSHLGATFHGAGYIWVEAGGIVHWYVFAWIPQHDIYQTQSLQPIPWQARAP